MVGFSALNGKGAALLAGRQNLSIILLPAVPCAWSSSRNGPRARGAGAPWAQRVAGQGEAELLHSITNPQHPVQINPARGQLLPSRISDSPFLSYS